MLEGATNFAAATVSQSNYRILNAGVTRGIVLRFGGLSRRPERFGGPFETTYRIAVELFARYTNDTDTENQLRDDMQAIMDRVDAYPELNGTSGVDFAFIAEAEESQMPPPELVNPPGMWRMRTLLCEIQATESTSFTE